MMDMPYLLRYSKLIFTFLLFIFLVYNEGILLRLKQSIAVLMFVIASTLSLFFRERKINSHYLITKNKPELISQLYVKNNTLCYAYWSTDGEIHDSTNIKITASSFKKAQLRNNQIWLNDSLITATKDLKQAPLLADNKIYYLSDFNQGYGFYTIRWIDLAIKK
jgi:predicted KAP-like P-loop ATPase